ncbi:hypothetical protein ACIF9R_21265 [Streptomyces sp. NPDC086080]|uniref:oxidoreductase n=1 Tax=Streptomyces sp. NPDC086080 TaxID=3365748 RepID=UPI0037D0B3F1
MTQLFEGHRLGDLTLPNRVVMAPMTRVRAAAGGLATPSMAAYYAQRATAGLTDRAAADRWLGLGADLISFGRAFIANPDLVERLRTGLPIAPVDEATYYQGGDRGYLTYPAYQHTVAAA